MVIPKKIPLAGLKVGLGSKCARPLVPGGETPNDAFYDTMIEGRITGELANNTLRHIVEFGVDIPGLGKLTIPFRDRLFAPASITRLDEPMKLMVGYRFFERAQNGDRTWVMGQAKPLFDKLMETFTEIKEPLQAVSPFAAFRIGPKATGQWMTKDGAKLVGGSADYIEAVLGGAKTLKLEGGGEVVVPQSLKDFATFVSDKISVVVEQVEATTGERLFENATDPFFPRVVVDPKTGRTGVSLGVGVKPSTLNPRLNETMEDLIENGRPYSGTLQAFEHYLTSLQKMNRDTVLAHKVLESGVGHKVAIPSSLAKWIDPNIHAELEAAQLDLKNIARTIFTDREDIIRERFALQKLRDQLNRRLAREQQGLGRAVGQEDIRTQPSGRGETNLQEADLLQREATVDLTKQEIAEITDALDTLPPVRVRGRGKNIMAVTKEQEDLYEAALKRRNSARKAWQGTLNQAKALSLKGPIGERAGGRGIGPAFGQILMRNEDAEVLERFVQDRTNQLLSITATAASIPRLFQTGLADVGHFGIQMSLLFFSRPKNWARAAFEGMSALADPKGKRMSELMASEAGQYAFGKTGIDATGSTITEATQTGGLFASENLLGRIPVVGSLARWVPRGFDAAILASRIHEANALGKMTEAWWAKNNMPAEGLKGELQRVGAYVDTKLGTPNMRSLGISANQDAFERGWLFYSNRYTRSTFGMLGWAASNGLPARDARDALMRTMAGAGLTFYAFAKFGFGMSDEEIQERLDPRNGGKFFSLPVGGNEYGFGSGMRSQVAFIGALTKNDNWPWARDSSWSEGFMQNPITRFLRGKTAPTTGILIDWVTGEDFLGNAVGLNEIQDNPELLLSFGSEAMLPFNMRAIMEARGGLDDKAVAALTETVGGRTSPRSGFSLLEQSLDTEFEIRSDKSPDGFDYDAFDSFEDLEAANPLRSGYIRDTGGVLEAQNTIDADQIRKRASDEQRYYDSVDTQRSSLLGEQTQDDTSLEAYRLDRTKGIDPTQWRKNNSSRTAGWIGAITALEDTFGIKFEDTYEPGTVRWGIEQWFAINFEDFVSTTGVADISGFRQAQAEAIAGLTSAQQADIRTYVEKNKTPLQREYRADVRTIETSGFWETNGKAWEETRRRFGVEEETREEYERRLGNELEERFGPEAVASRLRQDSAIKDHNKRKKQIDLNWERTTPDAADVLWRLQQWGYKDIAESELHLFR